MAARPACFNEPKDFEVVGVGKSRDGQVLVYWSPNHQENHSTLLSSLHCIECIWGSAAHCSRYPGIPGHMCTRVQVLCSASALQRSGGLRILHVILFCHASKSLSIHDQWQ